jgi:type II restriction enzyme
MDSDIKKAISIVLKKLGNKYPRLNFRHQPQMLLTEIIGRLEVRNRRYYGHFSKVMGSSSIRPDGGFLYFTDKNGQKKIVLVSEVKRQGTNDQRKIEGLGKQAKGNAIERLGKNLIGIRAIFKNEDIIPFVCFGSGCDFEEGSSIVDRVVTMNDFFELNRIFVKKDHLPFEPVSMFFGGKKWNIEEMVRIMFEISDKAVEYYIN